MKVLEDSEFPKDDATQSKVVIGRTKDDMIMVVMPPGVLATTFMLLATNHMKVTCEFVSALGFHMTNEDVRKSGVVSDDILKIVTTSVLQRHQKDSFTQSIFKKGDAEMFEGLYYGEFSPTELAAVGHIMREVRETMPRSITAMPVIADVTELWITASERFVTQSEYLLAVQMDGMVGGSA